MLHYPTKIGSEQLCDLGQRTPTASFSGAARRGSANGVLDSLVSV